MSSSNVAMSGFQPPKLAPGLAESLLREVWGLEGTTEQLVGERTTNVRLRVDEGAGYVLQVQAATGGLADSVFDMQTRALAHASADVATHLPDGVDLAEVVTVGDRPWIEVDSDDGSLLARVVTYLDGVTFDSSGELTPGAYVRIGEVVGGLAASLASFRHPDATHPMPWDLDNGVITHSEFWDHLDAPVLDRVAHLRQRLEGVADTMRSLPRQTIHNDVHVGNLVRADERSEIATGVIDFGDVVETVRAADVAIAVESLAPRHHDPISVAAALAAGYARRAPLDDAEIDAIGELVLARFALTVLLFGRHIREVPRLAERAADAMPTVCGHLVEWASLDPAAITNAIRDQIESEADVDTVAERVDRH